MKRFNVYRRLGPRSAKGAWLGLVLALDEAEAWGRATQIYGNQVVVQEY